MRISNKLRKEREASEVKAALPKEKKSKKEKVDWSKADKDNIPVCDIDAEESAMSDITNEGIEG